MSENYMKFILVGFISVLLMVTTAAYLVMCDVDDNADRLIERCTTSK